MQVNFYRYKNTPTSEAAHVSIQTSTYGINTGGTVYRMDDVPISLRPAFDSPFPSDLEVLTKLRKKLMSYPKKQIGLTQLANICELNKLKY